MKRRFALNGLFSYSERNAGWNTAGCLELGRRSFYFELTAVVSLLCYLLCLVTVVPSLTVAAEAAWGGWHGGGRGWRGGAATTPYYGCYGYGYPYYADAATVVCLTGGYGYAPNYSYGYGYPYAYGPPFVRRHLHAAIRGVRRVRAYRSAAASSSGGATSRTSSSPSTPTAQPAPVVSSSRSSPAKSRSDGFIRALVCRALPTTASVLRDLVW